MTRIVRSISRMTGDMRDLGADRSAVVRRARDEGRENHHRLCRRRPPRSEGRLRARAQNWQRAALRRRHAGSSSAARMTSTSGAVTRASRQPTYCLVGMVRLVSSGLVMSSCGSAWRSASRVACVSDASEAPVRSAASVMRLRSAPELVMTAMFAAPPAGVHRARYSVASMASSSDCEAHDAGPRARRPRTLQMFPASDPVCAQREGTGGFRNRRS